MDKKKAVKKIREAARKGRIEFADTDRMSAIPTPLLDDFLDRVFDVQRAFVSDESQISDFYPFGLTSEERNKYREDACIRIYELFGVKCRPEDYIHEVLTRIQESRQ